MRSTSFLAAALFAASSLMGAGIDQGLLGLVPGNTQMLAGVQIDKGKASSFGQYLLLQAAKQESEFQNLLDATGFDPRRDLQEVLIATWNTTRGATQLHPSLAIARGTFDVTRLKQAMITQGGRVETVNGIDVVFSNRRGSGAVAFFDSTLAVAGDSAGVQAAVANRSIPTTLDAQLSAKVDQASRDHEAWFASIVPGSAFPKAGIGSDNQQINGTVLQAVLQSSGGIHFGDSSVDVALDALTKTDQDTQSLTDVLRALASMVQMQSQNQAIAALLAPSLDAMQLTASGNTMHLGLSIPETTVEKLIDQRPVHQSANRKPNPGKM